MRLQTRVSPKRKLRNQLSVIQKQFDMEDPHNRLTTGASGNNEGKRVQAELTGG